MEFGSVPRANREIHFAELAGWSRVGVPGGVSGNGGGVIWFFDSRAGWEGAEVEEKAHERGRKQWVALERKSPPFAENAKDGAPSSTWVGWCNEKKRKKTRAGARESEEIEG